MADEFFGRFAQIVGKPEAAAVAPAPARALPGWVWIAAVIAAVAVVLAAFGLR
jgi:hypothetical protein